MRKMFLIAAIVILAGSARAQYSYHSGIVMKDSGAFQAVRFPTIRPCDFGSTGAACTLASVFQAKTGTALTAPFNSTTSTGPLIGSDKSGNYGFFILCGMYNLYITGAGVTAYNETISVPCDPANLPASTMKGHLLFSADNTYDIGATGATRPRDFHLGRNALIAGTLGVTGATTLSSTLDVSGVTTATATGPIIQVIESDQAGDMKRWRLRADGQQLFLETATDAGAAGTAVIVATRGAGAVVGDIAIAGYATFSPAGLYPGAANLELGNTSIPWKLTARTINTETNCASSASPAVCGSAAAGHVVVADGATTVVVNTTAVAANSQIHLTMTEAASVGTRLGITCLALGATTNRAHELTRTAGTSFTIQITSDPAGANPVCVGYTIVN